MTTRKYWFFTLLLTLFGLPFLQVASFALEISLITFFSQFMFLGRWMRMLPGDVAVGVIVVCFVVTALLLSWAVAYRYGRRVHPPRNALSCCGPFFLPAIFLLAAWVAILVIIDRFEFIGDLWRFFFYPPFFISLLAFYGGIFSLIPFAILLYYFIFFWAFRVGMKKAGHSVDLFSRNIRYLYGLIGLLVLVCAAQGWQIQRSIVPKKGEIWNSQEEDYRKEQNSQMRMAKRYAAFAEKSPLPRLSAPPSLQIADNYPQLDGATAFFPIYAAAARAIYVKSEDAWIREKRQNALAYSQTPHAYARLIAGEADLIFVLAPSKEQEEAAAAQGLTLTLTPIAKEAFVFLVNEENPLRSLELRQIRAIYSGEINDWREVGGAAGKILPFQRPPGSGSQTIMQKVMGDMPLRKPLRETLSMDMLGIIYAISTSRYRNQFTALGYSFRFYATGMTLVPGVRLLAIDGVEPTAENIRNGRYPLVFDVYMVSAYPLSENAQKLRDWFLSDEGQQLIEDVGYVPVLPPATVTEVAE